MHVCVCVDLLEGTDAMCDDVVVLLLGIFVSELKQKITVSIPDGVVERLSHQ